MLDVYQKAKEGVFLTIKLALASGLVLAVYAGLIGAGIAIGILCLIEKVWK